MAVNTIKGQSRHVINHMSSFLELATADSNSEDRRPENARACVNAKRSNKAVDRRYRQCKFADCKKNKIKLRYSTENME